MARLLKGAAPLAVRRVAGVVHDATLRAREILARAEADAARRLAEVDEEKARARAEASAAGREEGLVRAAASLAAVAAERARRLAGLEREVAGLAIDVARRVLARELTADPTAVVELAARVLTEARDRREVVLRVNPADLPHVQGATARLGGLLTRAPGLRVLPDPGLARGAVLVETETGRLDGGVEAHLAAFERSIAEVLP
jgi:type III secretion protein L